MSILQLLVSGNTSIGKDNTCSSKLRKYFLPKKHLICIIHKLKKIISNHPSSTSHFLKIFVSGTKRKKIYQFLSQHIYSLLIHVYKP